MAILMSNNEIVLEAFDAVGGSTRHRKTLITALSQRRTIAKELAAQLIDLAIGDGVLTMDATGEIRKTLEPTV